MKKTVLLAIAILTMLACSTPQPEKVTLIWDQGYSAFPSIGGRAYFEDGEPRTCLWRGKRAHGGVLLLP